MHSIQKRVILLSITAILALSGALLISNYVEAQGGGPMALVRPAEILPAGGRTTAGPAAFSQSGFSSLQFYFSSGFSENYPDLCVTIANEGATVEMLLNSAVVNTAGNVQPGQTRSICAQQVGAINLTCEEGDCHGYWRVDRR